MDDYKIKFRVEGLPIAVGYHVTLKTELYEKIK